MATKKQKRCFTIMIVPHSEEATFSLRLPLLAVQIAVGLLVVGVAGIGFLGYAYLRAAAEASEAQVLRQLNRAQQDEIDALAIETEKMLDQLRDVDALVDFVTDKLELDREETEEEDEPSENQSGRNRDYALPNGCVSSSPLFPEAAAPQVGDPVVYSQTSGGSSWKVRFQHSTAKKCSPRALRNPGPFGGLCRQAQGQAFALAGAGPDNLGLWNESDPVQQGLPVSYRC